MIAHMMPNSTNPMPASDPTTASQMRVYRHAARHEPVAHSPASGTIASMIAAKPMNLRN